MKSTKRERSPNFNTAEVQLLVTLLAKYKQIIENKNTDTVKNKDKEDAWKKNGVFMCPLMENVQR